MSGPLLKDARWVRQAFLVKKEELDAVDYQNRTATSASLKFTDTTPGGNLCINPPPQFTRYADPKVKGRFNKSDGMGRYYSEAIDDNNQIIHMRFGVPQFNSLTTFFTGFYNTGAGQLARTGRARTGFYYLGRAAGFVVSIMSWKLLAVHLVGVGLRFAMQKPSSKFYYLKPAMPLYWNAVQTMVNQIAVNRGIVPRVGGNPDQPQSQINGNYEFDEAAMKQLHNLLPDVFSEKGQIDVYALANRAQRLARKQHKQMEEAMNNASGMNLKSRMDDFSKAIQSVASLALLDAVPIYDNYLSRWFKAEPSAESPQTTDATQMASEQLPKEEPAGYHEFLMAELDDGAAFASFRVTATGSVNESFSNSVTESELANKINSMSSSSRSTNFSLAGGNLSDGVIGKVIGGIAGAVKDVASGIMDQMSVSGLAALGGAAFVDIPKHWHSSSASLPRASYTIDLVSPYGNPISQLINIHIPLAMLLAGALPISTGKQSYTSPFLVELYDKGRCQTRLGMIDSLSVTRGTGNLGFSAEGHAMALQVSFSVIDMSSVLHMPIAEGIDLGKTLAAGVAGGLAGGAIGAAAGALVAQGVFDDDTVFSDYMAVLAGMGLADQIYSLRKLKLNLTRTMANWESWTSASHFASFMGDTFPGRIASIVFRGTERDGVGSARKTSTP